MTRPLVASVADADSRVNDTLKRAAARPFTTVHRTVNGTISRAKNGADQIAARTAHPANSVRAFPYESAIAPTNGERMSTPRPPAPNTIPTAVAGYGPG